MNKKVVTRLNEDNDRAIGPFSSKAKTTPLTPPPSSSRSSSSSQKLHITSSSTVPLNNGKLNRQQVVPVASSAIFNAQPPSSSSSGMRGKKHTNHEEQKEEFITISEADKPVGPFTSKTPIKPRDKFDHSDLRSDLISSRSEEEETLVEEEITATAAAVSIEASVASVNIETENDSDNDLTTPFLKEMFRRIRTRTDAIASVPGNFSQQLQDVADFACKESSVMPTLPAGTLPLLGAGVFFIGVALMAYTGLCSGSGECVDAREFLSSFGPIDGENASEFFERAKARLAASFSQIDGESATELFERMKARVSCSFNQIDGESASDLYDRMIGMCRKNHRFIPASYG
mmetsp:Transcript_22809/g.22029  ORF Transcript_22809/g.22029 Transcript_22809/m.22029 type:complete len:346 (-) Transcript_22809:1104-2141(-)